MFCARLTRATPRDVRAALCLINVQCVRRTVTTNRDAFKRTSSGVSQTSRVYFFFRTRQIGTDVDRAQRGLRVCLPVLMLYGCKRGPRTGYELFYYFISNYYNNITIAYYI